jgi:putative ATP-binding cassette transporter
MYFQQFWTIAKSYWSGDEKWQARGLLLGVVLFLLAYTGLSVVLNNKRGVLISSLSAQDEPRFWQTVIIFIAVLVIYAPLLAGYTYLRDRLSLQWRKWLTHRFVDNYFRDRAYYNCISQKPRLITQISGLRRMFAVLPRSPSPFCWCWWSRCCR